MAKVLIWGRRLILGMLILIVFGQIVWRLPKPWPIRDIEVVCDFNYLRPEEIQTALQPWVQTSWLSLNSGNVIRALQNLSALEAVKIERLWPNRLLIEITEKKAFANWNNSAYLDAKGQIFYSKHYTIDKSLPQFFSPLNNQAQSMCIVFQAMQCALKPHFVIKEFSLGTNQELQITLDNAIKLQLGHEKVMAQLQTFSKLHQQQLRKLMQHIESFDFRYPNGLAIGWKARTLRPILSEGVP